MPIGRWAIGLAVVSALAAAVFWSTSSPTTETDTTSLSGQPPGSMVQPTPEIQAEEPAADAPIEAAPVKAAPVKAAPVKTQPSAPDIVEASPRPRAKLPSPSTTLAPAAPTKKAPPPAPATAKVVLTGDARTVWLTNDAGMFPLPGDVPPGKYQIKAWFSSAKPVIAGSKTITGTNSDTVNCNSFMERCQ